MGDRAYTRFSIPLAALAQPRLADAVCVAIGLSRQELDNLLGTTPAPDEASGYEATTIRLVDGGPCLVHEDPNANYGGSAIEQALMQAGVPFLEVNAAGIEYGATATVWLPGDTETIRVDHDLCPVVGIGLVDGRITLDPQEIRDFEHYMAVRRAVLLYPAAP